MNLVHTYFQFTQQILGKIYTIASVRLTECVSNSIQQATPKSAHNRLTKDELSTFVSIVRNDRPSAATLKYPLKNRPTVSADDRKC